MIVLLVFRSAEAGAGLAAAAGGLFILPYALLSATAGQLADRFDKGRLIRWNKAAEVALMVLGAGALVAASTPALLAVLFGLGLQATLFGPLKYGILPQHLAPGELLAGNALIEAATFGVILLGTILGGLLIGGTAGPYLVGALGIALSLLGLAASWFIPAAPGAADVRVRPNIAAATWTVIGAARAAAPVWRAILGLSWFWALGATYLALFPVLVRDLFHADNRVVTLLLAGFALGIGLGALLGSRLLRGAVSFRLVAPAAVVLSVCTIGFATLAGSRAASGWTSPAAMLGHPAGLLAWLLLLGAAIAGGVYSLPLNTVIQSHSAPEERSRMVAANNVMNALYMVGGAVVVAALSAAGTGPHTMLTLAGLLNLGVAWWFRRARPDLTGPGAPLSPLCRATTRSPSA
jgi:acyl-[acyl-carrier-protein]-phospholipid O-acyltransferase/long-chain-fatty-acid--[acyl-carrier-protein] ligase